MTAVDAGYTKEVKDGGIIVFRIQTTRRATVDAWYEDVAAEFAKAVESGVKTRFLYDIRAVSLMNSHVMRRASDLAKLPLPDDWRVATVITSNFVKGLINLVRTISLTSPDMFERSQIFTDEDKALAWLQD